MPVRSRLRRTMLRKAFTTNFVMGRAPHQIDIITTIDGVSFEESWRNRVDAAYGDEPTHYISKDDLVANKTAAGRPQDLADVAYLKGTLD